jgi:hypothetical protein
MSAAHPKHANPNQWESAQRRLRPSGMSGRQWVRYRKEHGIITPRHDRNPQWRAGEPRSKPSLLNPRAWLPGRRIREAMKARAKQQERKRRRAQRAESL